MPKNIRTALSLLAKRIWLHKTSSVVIRHHSVFSGVTFKGPAVIEPYCRLNGDPTIIIGSGFYMNSGCHLLGEIYIGADVLIGPKVIIWGRDHGISRSVRIKAQPHIKSPIIIGDDVWIGANATILKGVTLGIGSVIGAGAVVTRDIPEYAIAVGNPARVIKYRE